MLIDLGFSDGSMDTFVWLISFVFLTDIAGKINNWLSCELQLNLLSKAVIYLIYIDQ